MAIQEIKKGIYTNVEYIPSNVTCINTGEGLILVDTPTMTEDVSQWKSFIEGQSTIGVKYIIATHHHFDHITGINSLGDKVIMQEKAFEEMLEEGGTLREVMATELPGITEKNSNFILTEPHVHPEITFSDKLTINLGNLTLELYHIPGHTKGSLCVYIVEEKVLIAGDTLTSGMPPFMGQGNITQWISTLTWMKDLDVDTIVPGHGEICSKDEINRLLEYLTSLRNLTADLIKKGSDIEGITAEAENMTTGFYRIDPAMIEETKMLLAASIPNLYSQIKEYA